MSNHHNTSSLPSNWPPQVVYLTQQRYASALSAEVITKIRGTSLTLRGSKGGAVKILHIHSPSHPANGQCGLFASKKIPPNTHILDYCGEVHSDDRPNSDYDLSLLRWQDLASGEVVSIGIDARFMGNEARFINDYRGTGVRKPNAGFRDRMFDGELRMSVWSGPHGIGRGDEILVSYGKGWWAARKGDEEMSKE